MSGASRRRKAKQRVAREQDAAARAAAAEYTRARIAERRLSTGVTLKAAFVVDPTRCTKGKPRAVPVVDPFAGLFGIQIVHVFCFDDADRQVAFDQLAEASGGA